MSDEVRVRRSLLGRARGLGSSKSGVEHWWIERLTALALVPLTVWFVVAVLGLLGSDQPTVAAWVGRPVNTVLLLALIVFTFHHTQLGLQVVYEDYIHSHWRLRAATALTKGAALLLGLAGVVAVLHLAFVVPLG